MITVAFSFLFWLALAVIVGLAAHKRCGRDGAAWALLAFLISPLLAGALLVAVGPKQPGGEPFDWIKLVWTLFLLAVAVAVVTHWGIRR